jgi:hypothetical protein
MSVPARQPSWAVVPLLCSLQGVGWGPPLASWRCEPTYTASSTQHTGLLGQLLYEVLQLFLWWGGKATLVLAKESSCAAFSSPPPPHPGTMASSSP